jgi:hypothetical protein
MQVMARAASAPRIETAGTSRAAISTGLKWKRGSAGAGEAA